MLTFFIGCVSKKNAWLIRYPDGNFKRGFIANFNTPSEIQEFITKHFGNRSGKLLVFSSGRSKKTNEVIVKKGVITKQIIYSKKTGKPITVIELKNSKTKLYQYIYYDYEGNIKSTELITEQNDE